MLSVVLVIFFLSTSVDCEVFVNGATVCSNSIAVLTCTTNTAVLRWNTPGGLSTTYNSPTDIGDIRNLDGLYILNLTSVINMTVFTSTATTINPVINDQSLTCFDALVGGNSQTATITIKINVSPVINLNFTLSTSNCSEGILSWAPPNDVPNCVTGYYIEYDGTLYFTTETSITVPVTNNALNVYTVKATNGLMRNSTARNISVNARDVSPVINLNFTLNTSTCYEGILSWDPPNDVPNCVTGYYIEYDGMLYSTTETSITVPVTNNTINVYTVTATNGLMRNSTARNVSVNARDVSPVINLNFTLNTSNCSEGILSWAPPNDVPNCVTGYYIEYDGMLYSTTETSITVPVTNNTLNVYTVKATNGLMRNSTARNISVNASRPSIESISLTQDCNDRDNTTDTLLEISWNFTVPEISHVDMTRLLVYLNNTEVANTKIDAMSLSINVSENMNHTVTLVAYNCFGISTETNDVFVCPFNETDGTQNNGGIVGGSIAGGIALVASIAAIIAGIAAAVGHYIKKKNNNEKKDNIKLSRVTEITK